MGSVILVTGGVRAGKSRFALDRARAVAGRRRFIATADPALSAGDPEMARRIAAHRRERGEEFETIEAPAAPAAALRDAACAGTAAVVLDDLTLWVAARLTALGAPPGPDGSWLPNAGWPERFRADLADLVAALREAAVTGAVVAVVTNEVGWGIVPLGAFARAYVDALGEANSRVAVVADEVWLAVAGLPLKIR